MKIVVIGKAGLIGSKLVATFRQFSHEVIAALGNIDFETWFNNQFKK